MKSDVFALGLVFFLSVFGSMPEKASFCDNECPVYYMIRNDRESFFEYCKRLSGVRNVSENDIRLFGDLVSKMMEYDPEKRLDCNDVLEH